MSVRWCAQCDVPLLAEICENCGEEGQPCAKDLKPIFYEEKKYFEEFLGENIPAFAFRYRNRIITEGQPFLIFKIDSKSQKFVLTRRLKVKQHEIVGLRDKVRCMLKANRSVLRQKEKNAIEQIKKFSEKFSQVVVLFGGGKDSAVTAILAKKALGRVPLLFIDTTLEFPETYRFVKKFSRSHGFNLLKDRCGEFYRAKQEFFKLCRRLGPPSIYCRWCCHIFKEQPVRRFLSDNGGDNDIVFLTGIRKSESRRRGNYSSLESGRRITGQVLAQPIIYWKDADIWFYIIWKNIEINDLYKLGHSRVGCWPCPCTSPIMDLFRRITHPNLWDKFEGILLDYTKENRRSVEWVKRGLWRLRRPKRKKILIEPLKVIENDQKLLFNYRIPYRESLLERLKILGKIEKSEKSFIVDSGVFRINGWFRGNQVELTIECFKFGYVNAKRWLEKILSRSLNCIGCGACAGSCPKGAIRIIKGNFRIFNSCDGCKTCLKNSCAIDDSERLFALKLDPFLMSPCKEKLQMNHVVFANGEIGKITAEKLRAKGVKVEVHEKGKIICVNVDFPRWKIERMVTAELRRKSSL
jgi:phosphoadenosine phosphosulfate reductase